MWKLPKLSPEEKLIRAKIELQNRHPFFAYLATFLEPREASELTPTLGVRHGSRYLYYNPDFIAGVPIEEVIGLVCHEILHLAADHTNPERIGARNKRLWNIATDIWVNAVVIKEGLELPSCGWIPKGDEIAVGNVVIKNVSEKCAEEIYSELEQNLPKVKLEMNLMDDHNLWEGTRGASGSDQNGKSDGKEASSAKGGKGQSRDRERGQDRGSDLNWPRLLAEAAQYAKAQGKLPASLERLVEAAFQKKLDWKALLKAEIIKDLPADFTWQRPSRASHSLGVYLPSIKRASLEIGVVIDTSGSISQEDLAEFKGLIIDLIRSYDNLKAHVVVNDAAVHDAFTLDNGNLTKFKDMALKGGGGTDFRPAFEWLREHHPNIKLVVFFTDGFGTFPNPEDGPLPKTLWILQSPHIELGRIPFGKPILLEG